MDDLHKFHAHGDPLYILNELHQNAKYGGLIELRAQNPMPYMLGYILRKMDAETLEREHEQHVQYLPAWLTAPAYWYANTPDTLALLRAASKSPHILVRTKSRLFLRRKPPVPVTATTFNPINTVPKRDVMHDQHALELWTAWYMTGDTKFIDTMITFIGKNTLLPIQQQCVVMPTLDAFNAALRDFPKPKTLDDPEYDANVRRVVADTFTEGLEAGSRQLKNVLTAVRDKENDMQTVIGDCARWLATREMKRIATSMTKRACPRSHELFVSSYILDDRYKALMDKALSVTIKDPTTSQIIYKEVKSAGRRKRADERLVELKIEKHRMAKFTRSLERSTRC